MTSAPALPPDRKALYAEAMAIRKRFKELQGKKDDEARQERAWLKSRYQEIDRLLARPADGAAEATHAEPAPDATEPESAPPADGGATVASDASRPEEDRAVPDSADVTHLAETSEGTEAEAMVAEAADWNVGDVILDTYEVLPVIEDGEEKPFHASGGMGKVYKVHHRGWNMDLAVKCPRPESFATEEQKVCFAHECEVWVNLGLHPHTVSCYYVREIGGIPRLFAEYIDGGSLKDWIDTERLYEGGMEQALERILDIAIQFAWGVHYAHEQGLIHQDVKPANVMVTLDGTAKVTDFGLANARQQAGISAMGGGRGTLLVSQGGMTPAYCSPEQVRGEKLNRRTDVWSWAVSVLEMFQGDLTWQSGSVAGEALEAFLEHNGEEDGIPPMPEGVANLLRQCFQQNLDERPKTMLDCATVLATVYESETGQDYLRPEPKPADILADGLNNRALSFLDLGRLREAESAWQQALAKDPRHLDSIYNFGLLRWRAGRADDMEVLASLREAARASEDRQRVTLMTARVHIERSDGAGVLAEIRARPKEEQDGPELRTLAAAATQSLAASESLAKPFQTGASTPYFLCTSQDGRYAFIQSSAGLLRMECATGRYDRLGPVEAMCACVTQDGDYLICGASKQHIYFDDVSVGVIESFPLRTDVKAAYSAEWGAGEVGITAICVTPDGRYALAGTNARGLMLLELPSLLRVRDFPELKGEISSVCVTSDGQNVLAANSEGIIKVWHLVTGRCLRTFDGYPGQRPKIAVTPDGRHAVTGGSSVMLWDVATGRCLRQFDTHDKEHICLTPDGRYVLSYSDKRTCVLVRQLPSCQCLRTFEAHGVISVLAIDGRSFATAHQDGMIRFWQLPLSSASTRAAWEVCRPASHREAAVAENNFARFIESGHAALAVGDVRGALSALREARAVPGCGRRKESMALLWELCNRSTKRTFVDAWQVAALGGHTDQVTSISVSSDGIYVLSGSIDKTLKLWEVSTGEYVRTFDGHKNSVLSGCMTLDGHHALSSSSDHTIRLWQIAPKKCVQVLEVLETAYSVCVTPDGNYAVSGGTDSMLDRYGAVSCNGTHLINSRAMRLWELRTGRCIGRFVGHEKNVCVVCMLPDGRHVLSGSADHTVRLWEMSTRKCLQTLQGHSGTVASVCVTPNGKHVLSGSVDKTLRLWDLGEGRCIQILEDCPGSSQSHITSDGRYAVIGCTDGTLKLLDLSKWQVIRTFEGHTKTVRALSITPDMRYIVSGGEDNMVRIWAMDWQLELCEPSDWDEGARPHLERFLTLQTPYATELPADHTPSEEAIVLALTRRGRPSWDGEDLQRLLETLVHAGYGWLRPEGIKRELEKMAAMREGPPGLFAGQG